ncbi:hypothetical protein SAMN03159496_03588 [Rhizobium sp. NFR07]|uniref:hypothetical protein n=1 Tax=Rhizobium sp. NFR07 TaxID=1566262 RepID=UPI0008EF7636|nr:hypothetical protein [Rhizobium sp. NFR07]SFB42548.1 hypothetical protein SAMN03159496_03588 [Rhizobium sp. NFR07]
MIVRFLGAGLMLTMAAALPAEAQQPDAKPPAGQERCQPGDSGQEGGEAPSGDLSRKLDDCDGVLKAPSTGDPGMVEPAPDTGGGRVINPDQLPEGSNPSNGSGG